MRKTSLLYALFFIALNADASTPAPNVALALIQRSEAQSLGTTLEARVSMRVVHSKQTRTLEFLLWAKGVDKSVVKVLAPEKERATATLRIGGDFWSYQPSVERVQKLAPSMLKLAWLGADFSNGDLVRRSNLSRYYDHRIVGQEKRDGADVYQIESLPRKGAPVEPGKILTWITREDAVLLRQEYFGPDGKLQRTAITKAFRRVGDHRFAATLQVSKAGETGYTLVDFRSTRFDRPLDDSIFTQEFLKKRIEEPDLTRP